LKPNDGDHHERQQNDNQDREVIHSPPQIRSASPANKNPARFAPSGAVGVRARIQINQKVVIGIFNKLHTSHSHFPSPWRLVILKGSIGCDGTKEIEPRFTIRNLLGVFQNPLF
jgi:hypothetical protein